jgi:hypothetical protein
MTGSQLKQAADRGLVTQNLYTLIASIETGATDKKCVASRTCQRNGEFDAFLSGKPFQGLITSLLDLARSHDSTAAAQQVRDAASQLLAIDRAVAKEFLAQALQNPELSKVLSEPAAQAPAALAKLIEEVRSKGPSQVPLSFPKSRENPNGVVVEVGRKLGAGGMGGAVYLAIDRATGNEYALKHEPGSTYKLTVDSMQEGLHTPASLGSIKVGTDTYMLMKLGVKPDFGKLSQSDLSHVFESLDEAHHFSENFLAQDIPEYGITHQDIHQGNMMIVDGKLSLIDWGKYASFTAETVEAPTENYTQGFLKEFKEHYRSTVPLGDIPAKVDMRAINCATLTRHLILRIMFQAGKDNEVKQLGLQKDPGQFYTSVKAALPRVLEKAPQVGGQVALLVKLYEKQMSDIINGEPVTAKDSAAFFHASAGKRGRSNSI